MKPSAAKKKKSVRKSAKKNFSKKSVSRAAQSPALQAPAPASSSGAKESPSLAASLDQLALYSSLTLVTVLILFIWSLNIVAPPPTIQIMTGNLDPEPKERLMYLAALFGFPLIFLGLRALAQGGSKVLLGFDPGHWARVFKKASTVFLFAWFVFVFTRHSRFNYTWKPCRSTSTSTSRTPSSGPI